MRSRQTVEINGTIITEEDIWPWMVTAFEGGSNYWFGKINVQHYTRDYYNLFANDFDSTTNMWRWHHQVPFLLAGKSGYKGHELEIETPDGTYYLTIHKLFDGISLMAKESPRHYNDLISEDYDAITADVFLQYALFEKVIFG